MLRKSALHHHIIFLNVVFRIITKNLLIPSKLDLQRLSFNASERWGAKHSSVATIGFFFLQNKAKQCKTKEKQKRTKERRRKENKKRKEKKETEKRKKKKKEKV